MQDLYLTDMENVLIREIEEKDNKAVESIIRSCLIEFDGVKEGCAWTDPDLGRFSEIYGEPFKKYWVAEDENGRILGGVGIGPLENTDKICELQKMYCIKEARGTGVAHKLIKVALSFASLYYKKCYLETFSNMVAAHKFYEKYGFYRIEKPVSDTGHFACDVLYLKDLQ